MLLFAITRMTLHDTHLQIGSLLFEDLDQIDQLYVAYAPEPPFNSGSPETAPSAVLQQARESARAITAQRELTARLVANCLGIALPPLR